jgi:hypothetical protein
LVYADCKSAGLPKSNPSYSLKCLATVIPESSHKFNVELIIPLLYKKFIGRHKIFLVSMSLEPSISLSREPSGTPITA